MQQIADWRERLGMSEYAQRFAENRIDLSVLPDLTDQDLEKMGVILGDRRKMLRAIAGLSGAPPPIAPAVPAVALDFCENAAGDPEQRAAAQSIAGYRRP